LDSFAPLYDEQLARKWL